MYRRNRYSHAKEKKTAHEPQQSTRGKDHKCRVIYPEEREIRAPHKAPQPLNLAQER